MNISFLKDKGNKYMIFILLGLLILVIILPTGSSQPSQEMRASELLDGELEGQLKNILTAMEGVGKVEVMITKEETNGGMFYTENGNIKVSGVVVVAEGAGNPAVNIRISEVVKALFSVEAHKISIVKMRSQEGDR